MRLQKRGKHPVSGLQRWSWWPRFSTLIVSTSHGSAATAEQIRTAALNPGLLPFDCVDNLKAEHGKIALF